MRSPESGFSTQLLSALAKVPGAHFRKTNDRAQVGVPDIVGHLGPTHVEIEAKYCAELLPERPMPTGHPFTGPQIKELNACADCGGVALGLIACGKFGFVFPARHIHPETGKVVLQEIWTSVRKVHLPDVQELVCLIKLIAAKQI